MPNFTPTPSGTETQVSGLMTIGNVLPDAATLLDGGYVITWENNGADGDSYGIFGQRYDAAGNKVGGDFQVNTYTISGQGRPSVTGLENGGFVIAWQSAEQDGSGDGVYAQVYGMNGVAVGGEFLVNSDTSGFQFDVDLTALPDGGFVATWTSYGVYDVLGQRFSASGTPVGEQFQLNTYTLSAQISPSVTSFSNGGFVAVWMSYGQDGSLYGVYGQKFSANGSKNGVEFAINTTTLSNQSGPQVTTFDDGSFAVVWSSYIYSDTVGNGGDVFGQRFDATGAAVGAEFRLSTETALNQISPSLATLSDGGFVAVWTGNDPSGNSNSIFGQRFNEDGIAIGSEFTVITNTVDSQDNPNVTALENGGFVVAWEGYDSSTGSRMIASKRFDTEAVTPVDALSEEDVTFLEQFWAVFVGFNSSYNSATKTMLDIYKGADPSFDGTAIDGLLEQSIWEKWDHFDNGSQEDVWGRWLASTERVQSVQGFLDKIRGGDLPLGYSVGDVLTKLGDTIEIVDTLRQGYSAINEMLEERDTEAGYEAVEAIVTSLLTGGAVKVLTASGVTMTISGIIVGGGVMSVVTFVGTTLALGYGASIAIDALDDHYQVTDNLTAIFDTALIELHSNGFFSFSRNDAPQNLNGDFYVTGGGGNDTLRGNEFDDTISGSAGDDYLNGGEGADKMFGGLGSDLFIVDNVGDIVVEVPSPFSGDIDTVRSSVSFSAPVNVENIHLTGTADNDATGNSGDNNIYGNDGANRLNGGRGEDLIRGLDGDDTVISGNDIHDDVYIGGAGIDTLVFNIAGATTSGVIADLTRPVIMSSYGRDKMYQFENLTGSNFSDVLRGDSEDNTLSGRIGNDVLKGASGADTINGGLGKDIMFAGDDADRDVFVFSDVADSGFGSSSDVIYEFDPTHDLIDLRRIDANANVDGNQSFTFGFGAAQNGVWAQYQNNGNVIINGDVDGDQSSDFQIRIHQFNGVFFENDFLL